MNTENLHLALDALRPVAVPLSLAFATEILAVLSHFSRRPSFRELNEDFVFASPLLFLVAVWGVGPISSCLPEGSPHCDPGGLLSCLFLFYAVVGLVPLLVGSVIRAARGNS